MCGGLVAMFLEIGHERCPARTAIGRVVSATLVLLMDIAPRVLQVGGTEEFNLVYTGVSRAAQPRRPLTRRQNILTNTRALFDRRNINTVMEGHLGAHLSRVGTQPIVSVPDAECSIKTRNKRTLGSGFTSKLVRVGFIGRYALIRNAARESRLVLPAVDIRSYPVVIDRRVALFRHTEHGCVHILHNRSDEAELMFEFVRAVLTHSSLR